MQDVLTPEVIEELPLEKVIDSTLVKNNVTHQVISALKKKYGGMALKSIDDKQGYLEICEAKKEVRKIGIITEKLCKAGREDAIKVQKLWLSKEKEILAKIDEVQLPLEAEIKKYDDEQQRLADEEIKRQEERFFVRQSELLKMGAAYANGCFILNDVSFESNLIKESDEDIYSETILPKYQVQYQRNETERIAAEEKKKSEEAELKRQQDELIEKQREFNEQQAAFKKQQDEAAEVLRQQQLVKEREANDEREKLITNRSAILSGLGMKFNGNDYLFEDVNVNKVEIVSLDEQAWIGLVQKITPIIEDKKKQAEEKVLLDIELQKQEAIKKALAIQELEKQQFEQQKQEELAQADDKTKWASVIEQISRILIPEMKTKKYKQAAQIVKEKVAEITELL